MATGRYGLGAVGSGLHTWRVQVGFGCLSGAPSLSLLAVPNLGASFIQGKWRKPRSALSGVTVNSLLGGFSLLSFDIQYCDHCGLYLDRDWSAFTHRYINC
jgi:hypothetical protein